jgi:hypothetical protein
MAILPNGSEQQVPNAFERNASPGKIPAVGGIVMLVTGINLEISTRTRQEKNARHTQRNDDRFHICSNAGRTRHGLMGFIKTLSLSKLSG